MTHQIYTTISTNRPTHKPGLIVLETDTGNMIMSDGTTWHVYTFDETSNTLYNETHVSIYSTVSIHDSAQIIELLGSIRAETI